MATQEERESETVTLAFAYMRHCLDSVENILSQLEDGGRLRYAHEIARITNEITATKEKLAAVNTRVQGR